MLRPKGIVLAGGTGTRLLPMTRVTNKHLLPVYDRPMVYFPLESLQIAGIDEVMLVTGGNQAGGFVELLGNGREFGFNELAYAYQEGAGGIAAALSLADDFADGRPIVVILGDNLIQSTITSAVRS
ncbi:MAG: sugar phosphate nucleotidyltransferase, partial [Planctomycetota bacterium]